MDKIVFLGTILAVLFVLNMMMSPSIAASIHDFTATVKSYGDEFEVRLSSTTTIPQDSNNAYFGYGVVTAESFFDTILVTTTHGGFLESIEQHGPDDPNWHNHYLTLTDDGLDNVCVGLEVADISYDSPGDVDVYGETIVFDGEKTLHSINPLTGAENTFHGGETIIAIISFDIEPVFNDGGKLTNICIDISGLYPIK